MPEPLSVKLQMDEDAPADYLNVVFPIDINSKTDSENFPEIKYIKAYDNEKNRLIFDGILDEQICKCSSSACVLELHARSYAALLLDNEAKPGSYSIPSLKSIFEHHAKQYGFKGYKGSDESFSSVFQVSKGMSEWEVIDTFCREYLNKKLRVSPARFIDASDKYSEQELYFSNKDLEQNNYSYISSNIKRYKLISQVNMRCSKDGTYSTKADNINCSSREVERKRYIDCVNSDSPAFVAQKIIEESNKDSFELKLICPGDIFLELFDSATVDDSIVGYIPGLYVASIGYSLDGDLEKCDISLRKKV